MPAYRHIAAVTPAAPVNMGGLVVKQPLPHGALDQIDPFLLLHHARLTFGAGGRQQDLGVPPHPHRGFAPVTFIYEGGVHHRDSISNDSVVYAGGVQWTTAGRGLVHSERPPKALAERGGVQELIQLWVNLPQRHKMSAPAYQALAAENTPTVTSEDGRVTIQVVTGSHGGVEGPIETLSPLLALNATFAAGGAHFFPLPPDYNAFAYFLDGQARLNKNELIAGEHLAHLPPGGDGVLIEATKKTRVLLMAGAPLDEPVAASGPFVMNRSVEIFQAMQDYSTGKMGVLKEEFG